MKPWLFDDYSYPIVSRKLTEVFKPGHIFEFCFQSFLIQNLFQILDCGYGLSLTKSEPGLPVLGQSLDAPKIWSEKEYYFQVEILRSILSNPDIAGTER